VKSVCWNRDGGRVLSGSYDGTTRVWDVKSGKTILEFKPGLNVHSATYSPDQAIVVTGGESEEFVTIWDAKTGKRITNLKGHTDSVRCLAWTPNGNSIKTWNTTTWQQITVLAAHTNIVSCIAIFPNGRIFASALSDGTARLWNLENGQPICSPLQHANTVSCLSISEDGKLLVTGCLGKDAYT
jgi:WD40 repeat protein